jgi:predicted nuclease of restriction endonuclease-like (RecB) superfamily
MPNNNPQPTKPDPPLFDRVATILEQARVNVVRSVNSEMVIAYWLVGREIVDEEQQGEKRAGYGKRLIADLSQRLTQRYGKGFSVAHLKNIRQFHLTFRSRMPEIGYTLGNQLPESKSYTVSSELAMPDKSRQMDGEFEQQEKHDLAGGEPRKGFRPDLSWSHYRALMRVENEHARSFYELEAARNGWAVRQLERQIHSFYYERLLKSRDKAGMMELANQGEAAKQPVDVIKEPYVLEFLDLPESPRLVESELESALISRLQDFLLELGSGFAFIGRQIRLTLDGDHFYPDLIFYHARLKCYVVIDLKVDKLTHGDLGQMQMYVNYYDREILSADDNPTVGLILCAEKNDAVVRYVLGDENQQIFASRYKLQLPSEEDLRIELQRERRQIQEHTSGAEGDGSV